MEENLTKALRIDIHDERKRAMREPVVGIEPMTNGLQRLSNPIEQRLSLLRLLSDAFASNRPRPWWLCGHFLMT
jgi:hypothetical protein